MAAGGKLEVEIKVKSPAEKFWLCITDSATLFPKAFSHDCKCIQVLECDGKPPGSVHLITYAEGSPIVKVSTEKIEHVDEANKVVTCKGFDGEMLKCYKTCKGIIGVTPKCDGNVFKLN